MGILHFSNLIQTSNPLDSKIDGGKFKAFQEKQNDIKIKFQVWKKIRNQNWGEKKFIKSRKIFFSLLFNEINSFRIFFCRAVERGKIPFLRTLGLLFRKSLKNLEAFHLSLIKYHETLKSFSNKRISQKFKVENSLYFIQHQNKTLFMRKTLSRKFRLCMFCPLKFKRNDLDLQIQPFGKLSKKCMITNYHTTSSLYKLSKLLFQFSKF